MGHVTRAEHRLLAREASLDNHREKRYKDFGGGRPKGVVVTLLRVLLGAILLSLLLAATGLGPGARPEDAALRHDCFIEGGINR
jgi:hypothetical protein